MSFVPRLDFTLARERFPTYDVATLPPIPSTWEEVSWKCENCPSFKFNDYIIYTDFELEDDREFGGDTLRYTVLSCAPDRDDWTLETDDWEEVLREVGH